MTRIINRNNIFNNNIVKNFKLVKSIQVNYLNVNKINKNQVNKFIPILSLEERDKYHKITDKKRKKVCITSRLLLRLILSELTSIRAKELKFSYTANGKPLLKGDLKKVKFSVSHSGDYIFIATSIGTPIGIDIQKKQEIKSELIINRFFSESEKKWILSQPKSEQINEFYKIWTVKEAYVKMISSTITGIKSINCFIKKDRYYIEKNKQIIHDLVIEPINFHPVYFGSLIYKFKPDYRK